MSRKVERKKILIIELEPEMRIFLSNLLDTGEFEPILFEAGNENTEDFKKISPELIILDAMIPKGGTFQIYRNLKRDEALKNIPVIMLSTLDQNFVFQYQIGQRYPSRKALPKPEAYLEKPPEAGELLNLVRTVTEKKK